MSEQFDPHYEWLGIPPRDQPANHYRLLGIELFEDNLNVIEKASDRQMGHVRTFQNGKRSAESQRLLNELSAAKVTLLQADKKAAYDDLLRGQIQAEIAPDAAAFLPEPIAQPVPPAVAAQPQPVAPRGATPEQDGAAVTVSSRPRRKGRRDQPARLIPFVVTLLGVVAIGLIAAVYFGVFSSKEPVAPPPPAKKETAVTPKQTKDSSPETAVQHAPDQTPETSPDSTGETPEPASTLAKIDESQETIEDLDFSTFASALTSATPTSFTDSIESGGGIVTDRFLLCQSMAYDKLVSVLRPLARYGWRPLRIRPYARDGIEVAAVWTRDPRPWRFVSGVTESEYNQANQRLKDAGFEPVDVAGFADVEMRFAGVWVKSAGQPPDSQVCLGLSQLEFRERVQSREPSLIDHTRHMVRFGKTQWYCGIWKSMPPGAASADRFDGSEAFFKSRLQRGDHLLDITVSKRAIGGAQVMGATLVRGLTPTTQLYPPTAEEHLRRARQLAAQGMSPTSISAVGRSSGGILVASVWEPSSGEASAANATVAKTPSPQTAATRYALQFDGRTSVVLSNTRGLLDLDKQFTAEVWFRVTKPPTSNLSACFGTGAGRALHKDVTGPEMAGWVLAAGQISKAKPGDKVAIRWSDAKQQVVGFSNSVPALNNDWHHLAVCNEPQADGGWKSATFVDGIRRIRALRPAGEIHPSPSEFYLGVSEFLSAQSTFYGDMRACRLSNSIRYTEQFTPDETFEADESTLVLLQFDGVDPSVIRDVSGANRHGQIHGGNWIETAAPPTPRPRPNLGSLVAEVPPKERLAVPSAEERRAASEKVKDIYRDDFAEAKDATAMVQLANELHLQVAQTQDAAAKFGLLFEARLLAIAAVNPRLALRMTEQVTESFEVSSWTLKADTMAKLTDAAKSTSERRVLANVVLEMSEEALQANEFEAAEKQIGLMVRLNRPRDRDLGKASLALKTQIMNAKKVWQQAEQAKQALVESPHDEEAHLTLGRYLCFVAEDWENGLPHLARSKIETLQELASRDLQNPSESMERLALADAWYDWGQEGADSDQNGAWLRARHWYNAALPGLADLNRTKANRRLSEISEKVTSNVEPGSKFAWLDVNVGLVKRLEGHTSNVLSLAVTRNGKYVVSGSQDQTVRFWDLAEGKEVALLRPGVGTFARLELSPDDKFVIVAGTSEIVEIWNLQTRKLADRLDTKLRSRAMATARDSNVLLWALSSNRPGNLRLFALRQGPIGQLNCPGTPLRVTISDDGRMVAAGSSDGNVYVWNLRPPKTAGPFTGLGADPYGVALSPNGLLVAGCVFQQAMVWDIQTGDMVSRMPTGRSLYRIAFSPDSGRLLTAGRTNEVALWNVEDGREIARLTGRGNELGSATAVSYLPDPRGAVSTGTDGVIRVWRLPD